MEVCIDIKLTEGQKAAWDLIHRKDVQYLVLRWSRQCGKSVFCELLLLEYLFKKNTYNVYISPTFQLGRKLYSEITKMLDGKGIIKKANASTLTIETIFGSTIQCFSMEAYTSIRGTTCNGVCILDECAYYPDVLPNGEEPWANVIMPITKARKPKVVFVSTPRGRRGILWDMYLKAVNGEKGYAELSRTIYQDTLVTEEEINEIKKNISDYAFRQEFMVEFMEDGLSFFVGYSDCFDYDDFEEDKTWIGCDLSGDGTDATILTKVNVRDQVQQFEIKGTLDMKYKQIADIINSSKNLQVAYLEKNGLGSPMINEIKKLVRDKGRIREFETTNATKEEIVSEMAVDIANHKVHFQRGDRKLYEELGDFVVTVSKSRKLTFAARGSGHDDRVMSACIAKKAKRDYDSKITKSFANVLRL